MFRTLARTLLSNPVTNALLFNRVSGTLGEYLSAAHRRGRYARYHTRYDVAGTFEFAGPNVTLSGDGDVHLGANSSVGSDSRIFATAGSTVWVGANTALGHNAHLSTRDCVADQDLSRVHVRNGDLAVEEGDVRVGDDCWLGPFTVVTAGTEIGDNTVVDSQSVVTRDLPPYCIAAGAPAEVQEFKTFLRDDALAILAEEYRDVLDADLRIRLSVAGVL